MNTTGTQPYAVVCVVRTFTGEDNKQLVNTGFSPEQATDLARCDRYNKRESGELGRVIRWEVVSKLTNKVLDVILP